MVGPGVRRSVAARVLGISQTALSKWIAAGEIATVRDAEGRTRVPVGELLDLLDEIEMRGRSSRPVAAAIRHRRERADAVGVDLLPWNPRRRAAGHRRADLRNLAYHRAVARRLDEHVVADARARLIRWQATGRIHPRWAAEWETILSKPIPKIVQAIGADTSHTADLRQSSPFAGVLTEHERRKILRAVDGALA